MRILSKRLQVFSEPPTARQRLQACACWAWALSYLLLLSALTLGWHTYRAARQRLHVATSMPPSGLCGAACHPVPPLASQFGNTLKPGAKIALRDEFFNLIAIMTVQETWVPDKAVEAQGVFRTTDQSHPGVDYLMNMAGPVYVSGSLQGVQLPLHYDFLDLRRTPTELRSHVKGLGWSNFLAFQTRNPMHRAHIELTRLAAEQTNLGVVIHPVVGMTKPGDVSYHVRVLCYKTMIATHKYYKRKGVVLSLLPLAMRMAGPREALWHALIRKNHGASHFIVGRDHAGCKNAAGEDFYGAYDAQQLVASVNDKIGITIVPFQKVVFVPSLQKYLPQDKVPPNTETISISGTKFRAMMAAGSAIPAWFSEPKVIKILQTVAPPRPRRGFAIFFTGLSGGGKTTISHALISRLRELVPTRHLTILDGDVARTHLSKELGFSVADRNTNVARMGYVASEVVRHGGIAIASTISPFEKARAESRALVQAAGGAFVLVHVSTSVRVCAQRDVKGLYAKADAGKLPLTGVAHPYELPDSPDLVINADVVEVDKSVRAILRWLNENEYLEDATVGSDVTHFDLQALGLSTTGVVDVSARQCNLLPAGTAGSKLPRLVVVVAPTASRVSAITDEAYRGAIAGDYAAEWMGVMDMWGAKHPGDSKAALRMTLTSENVDDAASSVLSARGVKPEDGASVHQLVVEDDRTEVAWGLWTAVRTSAATTAGVEKSVLESNLVQRVSEIPGAPEHVLVSAPAEALQYLPNFLRMDPCASAIILADDSGEAPKGMSSSAWSQYVSAAQKLRSTFITRVSLLDAKGKQAQSQNPHAADAEQLLAGHAA